MIDAVRARARSPRQTRPPVAWTLALAWCAICGWFAFVKGGRVPLLWCVDLGFHELGHLVMYILPVNEILTAAMGSIMQCAVPLGLAVYFWYLGRDPLACVRVPGVGGDELAGREYVHRRRARTRSSRSSAANTTGRSSSTRCTGWTRRERSQLSCAMRGCSRSWPRRPSLSSACSACSQTSERELQTRTRPVERNQTT